MVAAAVVSTVGAVAGSVVQSHAANSAARKQAAAANNATAAQQSMFDTSQENLHPFIQTGTDASGKIAQLEGLNGADSSGIQNALATLPGYQFSNTQGLKAVQNSASARGLGISGAAQKGAASFATGNANTFYNNYLTGLQNTANTGANAANGLATAATATGQGEANSIQNSGNALAAGTLGAGNALTSGINGLQNAFYANKILGGQGNSAAFGSQIVENPLGLSSGSGFNGDDIAKISQDFANGY